MRTNNPWEQVAPTMTTSIVQGLLNYKLANALQKQRQEEINRRAALDAAVQVSNAEKQRELDAASYGLTKTPEGKWQYAEPKTYALPGSKEIVWQWGGKVGEAKKAPEKVAITGIPGVEGGAITTTPDKALDFISGLKGFGTKYNLEPKDLVGPITRFYLENVSAINKKYGIGGLFGTNKTLTGDELKSYLKERETWQQWYNKAIGDLQQGRMPDFGASKQSGNETQQPQQGDYVQQTIFDALDIPPDYPEKQGFK
jgi:hypothetical protein